MRIEPPLYRALLLCLITTACALFFTRTGWTQDTVTGAFEGTVTNTQTGATIAGATAEIINQQTGLVITKTTDSKGRFYQGLLNPGLYTIRVSAPGFVTQEVQQRLFITRTGEVVPVPVSLEPAPPATPTPTGTATPTTTTGTATPTPAPPAAGHSEDDTDLRARINAADGERGGAFTEEEVSTLPLGATSFVRSFDELALLLPGVAPPPQTLGSVAGPGVGAGVGSAGQ
ncbi:MAG TPA: carboxypeptidase-like regulatory domain-containing protein, partial [Pyrinomonadaceae bacterium]|nr:carboxypeptidase-like regulatory domain-containing protein [Pyrinomonadaceae bacterium]